MVMSSHINVAGNDLPDDTVAGREVEWLGLRRFGVEFQAGVSEEGVD
jgi:hypothetical protein